MNAKAMLSQYATIKHAEYFLKSIQELQKKVNILEEKAGTGNLKNVVKERLEKVEARLRVLENKDMSAEIEKDKVKNGHWFPACTCKTSNAYCQLHGGQPGCVPNISDAQEHVNELRKEWDKRECNHEWFYIEHIKSSRCNKCGLHTSGVPIKFEKYLPADKIMVDRKIAEEWFKIEHYLEKNELALYHEVKIALSANKDDLTRLTK